MPDAWQNKGSSNPLELSTVFVEYGLDKSRCGKAGEVGGICFQLKNRLRSTSSLAGRRLVNIQSISTERLRP